MVGGCSTQRVRCTLSPPVHILYTDDLNTPMHGFVKLTHSPQTGHHTRTLFSFFYFSPSSGGTECTASLVLQLVFRWLMNTCGSKVSLHTWPLKRTAVNFVGRASAALPKSVDVTAKFIARVWSAPYLYRECNYSSRRWVFYLSEVVSVDRIKFPGRC